MPDFTFVTYDGLPNLDPDDLLAVDALALRGIAVNVAVWNDPSVDWANAGICVIRSTWDYHLAHDAFLRWAQRVSAVTALWNPLPVIRWNSHKGYMQELADRGAPVVPTAWIRAGTQPDLQAILRDHGWERAVIKPAVGLATRGVMAVDATEAGVARANEHARTLLEEHDVMVQPFIESVEQQGERALVFIDGLYSHAARKTPFQILAPVGEAGETAVVADVDEIEVATRVAGMVKGKVLYTRVDLVRGADGKPLVIELELIEPSLFLSLHPPAPERFAAALARLL